MKYASVSAVARPRGGRCCMSCAARAGVVRYEGANGQRSAACRISSGSERNGSALVLSESVAPSLLLSPISNVS